MKRHADLEVLIREAVDCGYHLHKELGPGLLESVYEVLLEAALKDRGLLVQRQMIVPITFKCVVVDKAFRLDILVEDCLPIELKSAERPSVVHSKQLLTYLRILDLPLGLLMNFGMPTFKEGVQRVANGYKEPVR